jgi:4-hydroxy-tetrahydrodipicolinate synthase
MSFAGVFPVLHVPFHESAGNPVIPDALAHLVDRLIDLDADGVVVLGLASEAWKLAEAERDEVCEIVGKATAGRVAWVAGIEGALPVAIDRARRAVDRGASALMVLPPPMASLSRDVAEHFLELARSVNVPILIQDSPQVTGVQLEETLLIELAQNNELLRAVKIEGSAAGEKIARLSSAGIDVIAGWGGLHFLDSMRRGAIGCMPGSDLGPALGEIHRLARESPKAADELYRKILPLLSYSAQSLELLILSAKRALVRFGVFPSDILRQPARGLDEHERQALDALFDQLSRDEVPGW